MSYTTSPTRRTKAAPKNSASSLAFIDAHLQTSGQYDLAIGVIYSAYQTYCTELKLEPVHRQTFSRVLKAKGFSNRVLKKVNKKPTRLVLGIAFKEPRILKYNNVEYSIDETSLMSQMYIDLIKDMKIEIKKAFLREYASQDEDIRFLF